MSASTSKQDMSMDDILASIRSYVSEGQALPKSKAMPFAANERGPDTNPYKAEVIHLTEEVEPIELATPVESVQQYAQNIGLSANPNNPFQKLQSEIHATFPPQPTLSPDELLNQLATSLIRNWLDKNLLRIVERIVEKEIERIRQG
jgi:hypothetical protein